jgi:hypothetical protein
MKHWEVFQDSHIARIQDGPEHQDTAACKMVKDIGILMTSPTKSKASSAQCVHKLLFSATVYVLPVAPHKRLSANSISSSSMRAQ